MMYTETVISSCHTGRNRCRSMQSRNILLSCQYRHMKAAYQLLLHIIRNWMRTGKRLGRSRPEIDVYGIQHRLHVDAEIIKGWTSWQEFCFLHCEAGGIFYLEAGSTFIQTANRSERNHVFCVGEKAWFEPRTFGYQVKGFVRLTRSFTGRWWKSRSNCSFFSSLIYFSFVTPRTVIFDHYFWFLFRLL